MLTSKLKNSKLHAAQKRQQVMSQGQIGQNFNSNGQPRERPGSANSKSKFLTKTASNKHSEGSDEKNPKAAQQNNFTLPNDAPSPASNPPPPQHPPNSSSTPNQAPSQNSNPLSMFYPPQGASTHQPKTALQQKVLG